MLTENDALTERDHAVLSALATLRNHAYVLGAELEDDDEWRDDVTINLRLCLPRVTAREWREAKQEMLLRIEEMVDDAWRW